MTFEIQMFDCNIMDEETENAVKRLKSGKATGQAVISLSSVINFPSMHSNLEHPILSFCAESGSSLGYLCESLIYIF